MLDILIFILLYFFLLFSIIGYGIFFQKISYGEFKDFDQENSIFIGFYGLFFVTLISLLTSLLLPHNLIHNSLLHILEYFIFLLLK